VSTVAGFSGHHDSSPFTMLAQAIKSNMEDGNLKAAIRLFEF